AHTAHHSFPTRRSSDLHDAAKGGGLSDRTTRVGAEPARGEAGGDRSGGTARRAARDTREIPGVAGRLERRVLGGGAHGELVHVRSEEQTSELQSLAYLV